VKILFLARHFTYFRNYESVIASLAERGHQIHLAAEKDEYLGGGAMVERLVDAHPNAISHGWMPNREDRWAAFATKLRMTLDYLRYLEPTYGSTPRLRARSAERVPRAGLWLVRLAGGGTAIGRRFLRAALGACERAIPRDPQIDAYLAERRPDVVLMTPLIGVVVSPQLDYLASARARSIPTALCVWSWDHLSSKAILRYAPDRIFVWNETQKAEAVTMHGVPADRIVVTGAQCFDQWFDRRPSTDRAAFCTAVGLPDRPFLLYLCSALFQGTVHEARFVRDWIRQLRASALQPLASMPILVRPHPARMKEWADVDLSTEKDVAVWGRNPIDPDAKNGYFNSLHHSEAVIGLNTSAFLEAAIVGRPVFATLLPEHYENQEGTIHFHYLKNVGGGLLHLSRTVEEQFTAINQALIAGARDSARSRRFVDAFIRPHGRTAPATPVFVEHVEQMAALEPAAAPAAAAALLRAVLSPVAALMNSPRAEAFVLSTHERAIVERDRAHRARVADAWQAKDAQKAAEQQQKDARLAERRRLKAQRAAEWHQTKTVNRLKQRTKKPTGIAP
jgi:hypothetical protein